MAFEILRHLQYGAGSDFGQNLNFPPSRIVPLSIYEMEYKDSEQEIDKPCKEEKKRIPFIPPRLGDEVIVCQPGHCLPEPAAYFQAPHTFLKSVLYLRFQSYYQQSHLPKKSNDILMNYLKELLNVFVKEVGQKKEGSAKKLMQSLLGPKANQIDTDPAFNPHFSVLVDLLFPNPSEQIIVVHSNKEGEFYCTTPNKLPENLSNTNVKEASTCFFVLVQLSNNLFSPYGKTYRI